MHLLTGDGADTPRLAINNIALDVTSTVGTAVGKGDII